MVKISMAGPNVNWKFYDKIKVNLCEEFHTTPINVDSCGIHTVYNSFKAGVVATEWSVDLVLSFQGLSCPKGGLCEGNRKFTTTT